MITKHTLHVTFTALFALISFKAALALIPSTLNYQGHLSDSSGVPIVGPVIMEFAIADLWINTTGDAMTGALNLPLDGRHAGGNQRYLSGGYVIAGYLVAP